MRRQSLIVLASAALACALMLAAPALAQQKTAKQCNTEWTANKAQIQASGKTKKDFIAECRAGTSAATEGAAQPSQAPPPAPHAAAKSSPAATGAPAAAGEFASEAQAKSHCPGGTVVWANLSSKIYHFSGNRDYGNTKKGAYMCESDSEAAGFRAAKNEKRPQ